MEIARRMGNLRSLESSPELKRLKATFDRAAELTGHDSRLVRIEAVRVLVAVPRQLRHQWLDAEANKSFQKAFDEMIDALLVVKERGSAHRTLGSLYEAVGEIEKAIGHYETAIVLEPSLQGPRWNLSVLLEQQATEFARSARGLLRD